MVDVKSNGRGDGELKLREARLEFRVPFAFKKLMIRSFLRFILNFAFRCVFHRC